MKKKSAVRPNPFRDHVIALANAEKPYLPAENKDFQKCSSAIQQLTSTQGEMLRVPSYLLPPTV